MEKLLFIGLTFILGGIPFGLIFTKLAGLGDIRDIGSGNIGATNVLRTGNKKIAFLTLLCDALKGLFPILFAAHFKIDVAPEILGLVAVLGHVFSPFLTFKGGKGVATCLGVLLGINYILGVFVLAVWGVVAKIFKISSLSALIACLLMPVMAYVMNRFGWANLNVPILSLYPALILFTHRDNIKRLLTGKESLIR
jgi:glycerol-3-phosphate acyltransferase PlsY